MRNWRSMLYVPANRPDLIAKQERFAADVVVLDLEDGTPAGQKVAAREILIDAVPALRASAFEGAILVRVNSVDDDELHRADLACIGQLDVDGYVLPKAESVAAVRAFVEAVAHQPRKLVVLGFETVVGVSRAEAILRDGPSVDARLLRR
ncbi:aldolase/citrate lyase family protein [Yinghuangia aomiensis]